ARSIESEPEVGWHDEASNELERDYRDILVRCLSLDPGSRPADAGEVLRLFDAADEAHAAEARTDAMLDQTRRARRAAWRANVAAVLLACVVALLAVVMQLNRSQQGAGEERRQEELTALKITAGRAIEAKRSAEAAKEEAVRTLEYERAVWLSRLEE